MVVYFHLNGHIPWWIINKQSKTKICSQQLWQLTWLFFLFLMLGACVGPHIPLRQQSCHSRRSFLWHPQLTPCRHTAGAWAWWYMCPGEIVKSIWMGSGPPWGELELVGYSDWGVPLIVTQSPACGPWGGLCASYKGSDAIVTSNSPSFTQ